MKMNFATKFAVFEWRQKLILVNKLVFPPEFGNFRKLFQF